MSGYKSKSRNWLHVDFSGIARRCASAPTCWFPEDTWVGATLRISGLRMRVDERDGRCVMVNVDPVTLERNPAILRTIAGERDACLGVYGSTVQPGRVSVGDEVWME